jgi:hypothetical protein
VIKRPARDISAMLTTMSTRARVSARCSLRRFGSLLLTCAGSMALLACGPEDGRDELAYVGPLDLVPFAVTDFFTPSGQMGDGEKPDFLTVTSGETCKPRIAGSRGRCYNFNYRPGNVLWAGTYWAYPSNNWGSESGRHIKPWMTRNGQLTQRYNKVTFKAAAERDTFVIKLSGVDSASKTHTLRNAIFRIDRVDAPAHYDIVGDLYEKSPPTLTSPLTVNDPKVLLTLHSGTYAISLDPGWTLVAPNAMGMMEPVAATLAVPTTSFTIAPGVDAVAGFDFTVGAETIHLAMSNPTVGFNFFAGDINDPLLRTITCPDATQTCEHRDLISTAKPVLQLSRAWQSYSVGLLIGPPCVSAMTAAGTVETSKFADKQGVVACATGTLRADGYVANCPPGKPGILSADLTTITCCETPLASGVCNSASSPGAWVRPDDIVQTVIGGFGWATNYAEFEAQSAILAGTDAPMAGMTNVDANLIATLPNTVVYLDDIVWDFVPEPLAATP